MPPIPKQMLPHLSTAPARALPQNIAHRGYRAKLPENSIKAFAGALAAGAVALETDVHLSKDKVVVLSHDPTLKRCFGRPDKIADCDWALLETLRTTKDPEVPMARLEDLLEFLAQPSHANVWVLIDIKRDDDPEELVARLAETVLSAPGDWSQRIVLGCWEAVYMRHCQKQLPGFPIAYIGFSLAYSYELLKYECVTYFNLLQNILVGPRGRRFIRQAQAQGRYVLAWTVNAEEWMDWSIRNGIDGVITDDPARFAEIRKRWEDEEEEDSKASEVTPLASKTIAPPAVHPPTSKSLTGLYIRRWARLYTIVGLLQTLEQVFVCLRWAKRGRESKRIQEALGSS